ncbi:hypothetical protein HKK58_05485 [Pseudomonas sp. ADAK22]|uniref:hypothetical protein n=1 Tax=Pseudomonas sp. ADAK22 TaxID=2730851 RepID=UPI0014634DCF|nr:hypothetical protein [Pseudomonas sp. ADAK22]QJI12003.1 hypothetical protein HKK58_05485 [Pseudomonas sp. ADAK22]
MYAIKLTLLMLVVLLYVSATACWFFWIGPCLLMDGESENILGAFAGTCIWLLITFGMVIHIIKAARPTAGGGR